MDDQDSLADYARKNGLSPSAARPPFFDYLGQVWQRRHFVWAFASARNIATYTDSRLGQVWQVLTPLLNAAVYYLIFGFLMGTSRGITDFVPFLVIGVFVFTSTQSSVLAGSRSITQNLPLIRALHFPRATLPLGYTIIQLQQLIIAMLVCCTIVLGFGEPITWRWLLLIPVLLLQLMFNIGFSLAVARVGAKIPDVSQLLPFILRTWFYVSAVFIGMWTLAQKAPHWAAQILIMNPGSVYVELTRRVLMKSYTHTTLAQAAAQSNATCNHPAAALRAAHPHTIVEACREHAALATMGNQVWIWGIFWAVVMLLGGFWFFYQDEVKYGRG